ncbi:hypothetical protein SKAU_G00281740 [Synaphobranchus kaupii]|uniref:Uncharacterized protein n=1 Tax=Synaphobranchus kaupii TaxID=118154 RepID=A0A9Q1EX61_SYNKA|nr:hypothetical protein SKAU_G00281740 [Synaphobranchus kaupii]
MTETEEKVKKIVAEKLQLQQEIEVERAHRTGKPGGDRPRSIVVKLLRHKDRSAILQRTKSLKGSKIYINEDFTDAVEVRMHCRRLETGPDAVVVGDTRDRCGTTHAEKMRTYKTAGRHQLFSSATESHARHRTVFENTTHPFKTS